MTQIAPVASTSEISDRWTIANLSVALFASVMGICGLGLLWREAHELLGAPAVIGETIIAVAVAVYCVLVVSYAAKWINFSERARAEFNDPVSITFFPTFPIGTLLIASAVLPYSLSTARVLWIGAAAFTLLFALIIVRRWIVRGADLRHVTPQWFMPVVGNIVAAIGAPKLGYPELGWFFLSVGLFFWVVLFTIIFFRLVLHDRLPAVLRPTFFIFLGPPAVAFIAYIALAGDIDNFAKILFYSAVFVAMLLVSLAPSFFSLPFAPTWWSFTFPLDAFANAGLHYGTKIGGQVPIASAVFVLAAATAVVAVVAVRTLVALFSGALLRQQAWSPGQ